MDLQLAKPGRWDVAPWSRRDEPRDEPRRFLEDALAWDFRVAYYMNYLYIYNIMSGYYWPVLCYLWDLLLVMIGYWMI